MTYTSAQTLEKLYLELGLQAGENLATADTPPGDAFQRDFFDIARQKLGIESIYFYTPPNGASIPYIYFRRFEGQNPTQASMELAELHRLAWNMGKAPLLVVTFPDGYVRIYNTYKQPAVSVGNDYETGLIEALDVFSRHENERRKLQAYHHREFETGRYWQRNQSDFELKERADYKLLESLKFIRRELIAILSTTGPIETVPVIVNSLLGRAIFIKYLEDRKDANGKNVFPDDFFARFREDATCFIDLLGDKNATYELFAYLSKKFNGDIFPVSDDEKRTIDVQHLKKLRDYLTGQQDVRTGQLGLWRFYSFDVLPIEFISNIYEEFFHIQQRKTAKNKDKNGAHYTPYHLVSFLVDEIFPWEGTRTDFQVLDPACGSGIFLVEIYRRIISHWRQAHPHEPLTPELLKQLLADNIYGVDLDLEAVRVAAFSLYLTLCDYLEPRQIWEEVTFPSLRNSNLFACDFFEPDSAFAQKHYDLVIGNPPWSDPLTPAAEKYCREREAEYHDRTIAPDRQIALAFLWKAAELSDQTGEICLLMPSKGLLFNRSGTHRRFRSSFLQTYHVKTIINFSASRRGLFQDAVGPSAAIFYTPSLPDESQPIWYCTPKPSHSAEDQWQFFIDPQDIARLPRQEAIGNDVIWKVAMWGGPRDYALVKKLMGNSYQSLAELCKKREWTNGEGIILGKPETDASFLLGKPYIEGGVLLPRFTLDIASLPLFDVPKVQRSISQKSEIFEGPHILVKQSPIAGENSFRAALVPADTVFTQSLLGIHGNSSEIGILAKCCLFLNSRIPLYFALMSSGRWLVERDELAKHEIMNFPMPLDLLDISFSFDDLKVLASQDNYENAVSRIVEPLYRLTAEECMLINDAIGYTLGYFKKRKEAGSSTYSKEDADTFLQQYLLVIGRTLENSFGQSFRPHLFSPGSIPLRVVALEHVEQSLPMEDTIIQEDSQDALDQALAAVNEFLVEKRSPSLFIRRNLRLYIGKTIYIIKPDQRRYWTKSSALRDADEIYADMMEAWGKAA